MLPKHGRRCYLETNVPADSACGACTAFDKLPRAAETGGWQHKWYDIAPEFRQVLVLNAALIRHARRLFYGQALVKQTQTTVTPRVRRRNDSPGVPISGTQKFMRSSVIHDVYVPWCQITQSKYFLTATPKTRRASNGKPYVITARDPEEHRGLPRLLAGTFGDSPRVIRKKFGTMASHSGHSWA